MSSRHQTQQRPTGGYAREAHDEIMVATEGHVSRPARARARHGVLLPRGILMLNAWGFMRTGQ